VENDFESDSLIIIEDADQIGAVVAVNLASHLRAHVKVIPGVSRNRADEVTGLFREYEDCSDNLRRPQLAREICAALDVGMSDAELSRYSCCVVFTAGMPYGAAIRSVATGHFLISPDCGLQVLRDIAADPVIRTAFLIDSSQVKSSETKAVAESLRGHGLLVHTLTGTAVTGSEVGYRMRELPYDLICFVAHGGYPLGHRLTLEFTDPDGSGHTMVVRKVTSISPVIGIDDFQVHRFVEPESIDGLPWLQENAPRSAGAARIFTHLSAAVRSGEATVTQTEEGIEMRYCNCIRLGEENFFAPCDTFGSRWGPIVVNNSCNSIHHLSDHFILGGARAYVGTLFQVMDPLAEEFLSGLVKTDQSLGEWVFNFNKKYYSGAPVFTYLVYGLPTTLLSRPIRPDCASYYREGTEASLNGLIDFRGRHPFHKQKKHIDWTIDRLKKELQQPIDRD
jgi:hypothetical protein